MFRRKIRQRLKHLFTLALASLVLNLLFPPIHSAAAAESLPTPANSLAEISQVVEAPVTVTEPEPTVKLPTIADKPVKKRLVVRASAYSSTVDQTDGDPFTAASGAKVHDGMIAWNGVPFGTKIRIPDYYGDKVFTVGDRMNARWGTKKIDIWMTTRAEAIQWGVRTITIEII